MIAYRSYYGKTLGVDGYGHIGVRDGFGFFGEREIAYNGLHVGGLVNGIAYDNKVPFGVPQNMWEDFRYYVIALPQHEELTLRQSADKGHGEITIK